MEPLAGEGLLRQRHLPALAAAVLDQERDAFERGRLLAALAHGPPERLPPAVLERLPEWAAEDDELGRQALVVLAHYGLLPDRAPDLVRERLGLWPDGAGWTRAPDAPTDAVAAFATGLLFRHRPAAFAAPTAALIREGAWEAASQVLLLLRRDDGASTCLPLPPEVVEALVWRVRERAHAGMAEPPLLDDLARLAPATLASAR